MHSDQICHDYYIDVRENRRDLLHRRSRKSKGSIVQPAEKPEVINYIDDREHRSDLLYRQQRKPKGSITSPIENTEGSYTQTIEKIEIYITQTVEKCEEATNNEQFRETGSIGLNTQK